MDYLYTRMYINDLLELIDMMIYGLLRITNAADPFLVLDDVYFNKKIKIFDTANCYGRSETIFGDWMISRKIDLVRLPRL